MKIFSIFIINIIRSSMSSIWKFNVIIIQNTEVSSISMQNSRLLATFPEFKLGFNAILLISLCRLTYLQNIVCDPGFDGYISTGYIFAPSNFSCWYQSEGDVIQVKCVQPGCIAQLVSEIDYNLCQTLKLQKDETYQLTFDSFNIYWIGSSVVEVKLANKSIYTIETVGRLNGSKGIVNFTAQNYSQKLCFFPLSYTLLMQGTLGPCIDNVTVIRTSNYSALQILCPYPSSSNLKNIKYKCKYNDSRARGFLEQIAKRKALQIIIQSQLQQNYEINVLSNEQIQIILYPKKTYILKNVSFQLKSDSSFYCLCKIFFINFNVYGSEMLFQSLSEQQIKNLQDVSDISQKVLNIQKSAYQFMKLTFVSYFFISIFSFWNLSLMYNFLRISTVPHFCKFIIEKLIKILFELGSVMNWLKSSIFFLQDLDFSNTGGTELIEQLYQGESWFGNFEISSGFLNNNSQSIFILIGVFIKVLIVFFLNYFKPCNNILSCLIPKNTRLLKIFLTQVISAQIFMTISSGSCLINYGFRTWKDLLNNLVQVITLWTAIVILPLYFLAEVNEKKKKWKNQIKGKSKKTKNKEDKINYLRNLITYFQKKVARTSLNNIIEYFSFVTIPLFIILKNNSAFLVTNGVVIMMRFYYFIRYRKYFLYSCRQKIFVALNILIWLVYHSIYVIFWVIQKTLEGKNKAKVYENNQFLMNFTMNGGYTILIIILGGGFVQIVDFIIDVLQKIYRKIKKITKKTKISNNIIPRPQKIPEKIDRNQKITKQLKQQKNIQKKKQVRQQKNRWKNRLKIVFLNQEKGVKGKQIRGTVVFQPKVREEKKIKIAKQKQLTIKKAKKLSKFV